MILTKYAANNLSLVSVMPQPPGFTLFYTLCRTSIFWFMLMFAVLYHLEAGDGQMQVSRGKKLRAF